MPNILTMQCSAGMAQNYTIPIPGVTGGGTATVTNAGALRSQVRTAFGTDLPPTIDVTSFIAPALPSSIPAGYGFQGPLTPTLGGPHITVAFQLSQGGSVTLNRYLDMLGQILLTSTTQAATANAVCVLDSSASPLAQTFSLS